MRREGEPRTRSDFASNRGFHWSVSGRVSVADALGRRSSDDVEEAIMNHRDGGVE
jgi:hypothetical protein